MGKKTDNKREWRATSGVIDNNCKSGTANTKCANFGKKIMTRRDANDKSAIANTKGAGLEKKIMTPCDANGKSAIANAKGAVLEKKLREGNVKSGKANTNGKVLEKKVEMQPDKNGKSGTRKDTVENAKAKPRMGVLKPAAVIKALRVQRFKNSNNQNSDESGDAKINDGNGNITIYYKRRFKKWFRKESIMRKYNNSKQNSAGVNENNINTVKMNKSIGDDDADANKDDGVKKCNAEGKDNNACDYPTKYSKKEQKLDKAHKTRTYGTHHSKPKSRPIQKNKQQNSDANDK